MRNYFIFLKKEIIESIRTYKLFIMLIVFFVFGMMSPLTAKLLPEIFSSFTTEGITISITNPTAIDSWTQFFKNISQVGLIVMVILFHGILATELSKGTLINMLTKGLSRSTVILSKFTSMAIVWTLSYTLAFIVCWGYTVYLFPGDQTSNLLFSVFCLWLFGMFLLSVLLFASTLIKNNYGSLLITGGVAAVLTACNMASTIQKYNPSSLAAKNVDLLTRAVKPSNLFYAVLTSVICILIMVGSSITIFRKKQL